MGDFIYSYILMLIEILETFGNLQTFILFIMAEIFQNSIYIII